MNRTYPSTWLRPLDLLFYQNVKGTPPKSDYYPMFLELAARVIFFNTIKNRIMIENLRDDDNLVLVFFKIKAL